MKTLNKILKLDKEKFKIPKCVQDIIPIVICLILIISMAIERGII